MRRRSVNCDLPYIKAYKDRLKRWRFYFRRKCFKQVALPGKPGSPEFVKAYQEALSAGPARGADLPPASTSEPGAFGSVRDSYIRSAEFANLAATTQREMKYALNGIAAIKTKSGAPLRDVHVRHIERRHILEWRDDMKDRPGAVNKMIRALRILLAFAIDRDLRTGPNPAAAIKMLKLGSFRDWTDAELKQFEQRWKAGTLERTAYALALYTGQRRADLATMRWADVAGETIRVTQHKTGAIVMVPMHRDLIAALATWREHSKSETILCGQRGHTLNPVTFGHIMAEAIGAAGLPDDCVLHGLRKTTARIVAELGGSVGSMTGHLSPQMEKHYSRRADQSKNAKAAVLKWERKGRKKA